MLDKRRDLGELNLKDDYLLGIKLKKEDHSLIYYYLRDGKVYSTMWKMPLWSKPIGMYVKHGDILSINVGPTRSYLYPSAFISINTTLPSVSKSKTAATYCFNKDRVVQANSIDNCNATSILLIKNVFRCGNFPLDHDLTCMKKERFDTYRGEILSDLERFKLEETKGKEEISELTALSKLIASEYVERKEIIDGIGLVTDLNNVSYLIGNDIAHEDKQVGNFLQLVMPNEENKRLHNRFYSEEGLSFRSEAILNKLWLTEWVKNNVKVYSAESGEAWARSDSYGNIYVNKNWLSTLTEEEVRFVIKHEVIHVIDNILQAYEYSGLSSLEGINYKEVSQLPIFSTRLNSNLRDIVLEARIRKQRDRVARRATEEVWVDMQVILSSTTGVNDYERYCNLIDSIADDSNRVLLCRSLSDLLTTYSSLYYGVAKLLKRSYQIADYAASTGKSLVTKKEDREKAMADKVVPILLAMPGNLYRSVAAYDDKYSAHRARINSIKQAQDNFEKELKEF